MSYLVAAADYRGDVPACACCGALMALEQTQRFRYPDGRARWFWRCETAACDGIHGAHPDGRPLGTPADNETRAARIEAHDALSDLMAVCGLGKDEAYLWMQSAMKMTARAAHIGRMDLAQCRTLMAACAQEKAIRTSGGGAGGRPGTEPGKGAAS